MLTALKPKNCKVCRVQFMPKRRIQPACSLACEIELAVAKVDAARRKRAAAERMADKVKRTSLKTIRELLSETQAVFNAFIRERDKHLPCVSCGRYHQGEWHAGHFMSTGARSELRFDESNVHKQCQPCNVHLSGNLLAYRAGIIARCGQAELDRLEGRTAPHKWQRDELAAIKKTYAAKRRELTKEQA